MKQGIILMFLVGLFFSAFGQSPALDKNWATVFQDDFSSFNTNLWKKANKQIHGKYVKGDPDNQTEEAQVYMQDNAFIQHGKLVLETNEQEQPCPKGQGDSICQYGGTHSYTSGQVESVVPYKYGWYEIRAQLPASNGYWPAFWFWHDKKDIINNNCWYNEIDVFEAYGNRPNEVKSRAHWCFTCPLDPVIRNESIPHSCDYATGYHWYGVEWDSTKIIWYVDGKAVREIANNMDGIGIQHPMYIILNVALYPGSTNHIDTTTIFPNYMYVDQANAYRLKCDKNTVVNEIPDFNTFYYAIKKSISLSGATTMPLGSNISLRATDFIELQAGFEVPMSTELYLGINHCE
jgi:beta-glucanase (GH16 family)